MPTTDNQSPYRLDNVRHAIGHYLLGRGASAVIGIASAILLVRIMDVAAYAGYIALMGLAGIAAMVSSLGLERAVTRYVPEGRLCHLESKLKAFAHKVVLARFAATLLVTSLLAAAWPWLVELFDFVDLDRMPWALAIFLVANSLFALLSTILQALVRHKLLTEIIVLIWGGRLVAIGCLAHLEGGLGLEQVLWLMALPELAGAAVLFFAVDRALHHDRSSQSTGASPETSSWPQWHEARNLAGHAYAFNILASIPQGYFMRTLVAATLPVEVVAAYGFFSSLVDRLKAYLPIQLMYNLFEPVLVARYLEDRDELTLSRHIRLMYKANLLIIVMVLVFLAISGQAAVGLVTGGKFVAQTWMLLLLVVQVALGSHVLAIQLVVNVLKCNHILSRAGAIALAVMLCFIGIVYISGQPLLLLYAVLVYSLTVNTVALRLLARRQSFYRPPRKEAIILFAILVPVYLLVYLAVDEFDLASRIVPVLLLGVAAGMALLFFSFMSGFASEQEVKLLKYVIQPSRNARQ